MVERAPLVNGERLWSRLMEMARIGATPNGGVCRLAMSDADKAGRELFLSWCEAAGMACRCDAVGNLFARRTSADTQAAPIVLGSHLDSQPTGGKFDGVYGVLAALEVVETLNDHGLTTVAPLEIAVWTNEEGARFAPAMLGSGVFAGVFELEEALSRTDSDGVLLGDELARLGYAGTEVPGSSPVGAFLEVHIEQGPILEAEKRTIGIVTGVQGIRWYTVTVQGKENHAGPFPMSMREDPVQTAVRLIDRLYERVIEFGEAARMTIGQIGAQPGSINTVPGTVVFSLDVRHPEEEAIAALDRLVRDEIADAGPCRVSAEEIWYSPPVRFDRNCIDAIREAVTDLGYSGWTIVSGAGHDAVYLSRVAPTAMVFVPCKDGLSHNEAEHAEPEDLEKGANVLLHAALTLAGCR